MYYAATLLHSSTAPPPPGSVPNLIRLTFSFHTGIPPLLLGPHHGPILQTFLDLTLTEFNDYENAYEMIAEKLRHWPISGSLRRQQFIEFAMQEACDAVGSIPHGCSDSHVYLHVHLAVDDGQYDEEYLMNEDEVHMTPTDDSLIRELVEKKVVMSTNSESCSICMEELPAGSEAVTMPCSHVFHQDCIVNWLRTSHYCPLCRFEMRAESS